MTQFQPCTGATSDHAWRSIAVDLLDDSNQSTLHVQGATWNTQAKCESLAKNRARAAGRLGWVAHGNNPLDIDETWREYQARKAEELQVLERIMSSGNDFVFLQEPDWLNSKQSEMQTVQQNLQALLQRKGWSMVVSPDNTYQKLVTLYNTNKLTLVPGSEQGRFGSATSRKFRGLQADFVDTATGQTLSLVNLHLEYGVDYRGHMLKLQNEMARANKPCIMGGDTNNVQNMQLDTMLGDWHAATCIEKDARGALTTVHASTNGQTIQKTYDGFFVNPGQHTRAKITDKGGMKFSNLAQGGVEYIPYRPTSHTHHLSERGAPWQRQRNRPNQPRVAPVSVAPVGIQPSRPAPVSAAAPVPPQPSAASVSFASVPVRAAPVSRQPSPAPVSVPAGHMARPVHRHAGLNRGAPAVHQHHSQRTQNVHRHGGQSSNAIPPAVHQRPSRSGRGAHHHAQHPIPRGGKNPSFAFALALLASSVVICALSIAVLVMLPGPLGIGLGVGGLLVSAGMFAGGMTLLNQNKPTPAQGPSPKLV